MTISEKSAYLKGLADGLKLDRETAEGRLIGELIDLVSEIATTVETIDGETEHLSDYVDELDQDLGELEEYVFSDDCDLDCCDDDDDGDWEYGEYDDEDEDEEEDEGCDGVCEGCSGCEDGGESGDVFDVDAEGMRCLICENCGDTICYDESIDPKTITCPACGKPAVNCEDK